MSGERGAQCGTAHCARAGAQVKFSPMGVYLQLRNAFRVACTYEMHGFYGNVCSNPIGEEFVYRFWSFYRLVEGKTWETAVGVISICTLRYRFVRIHFTRKALASTPLMHRGVSVEGFFSRFFLPTPNLSQRGAGCSILMLCIVGPRTSARRSRIAMRADSRNRTVILLFIFEDVVGMSSAICSECSF